MYTPGIYESRLSSDGLTWSFVVDGSVRGWVPDSHCPALGRPTTAERGWKMAGMNSGPPFICPTHVNCPTRTAGHRGWQTVVMSDDDPYLWLEEVTGETALAWVRERNAETVDELTGVPRFGELRDELRQVLDAGDRIPYPRRRGPYLYNFWRDAGHPRGLWRRTTLAEYRTERPAWEPVLDVDALAEAEGESWVWQGAAVLRPGNRLALVELSRGGADAAVVREFDLATLTFVEDGFRLPEAKSSVGWIDADTIYVGTDFGPGSLTSSGYPRIVKQWRRGTPLAEAAVVYEAKPDDVSAYAYHDPTEGFERDFVYRN